MIKHRKIIICILLSYALFLIGIFDVKAYQLNSYFDTSGLSNQNYYFIKSGQLNSNNNVRINLTMPGLNIPDYSDYLIFNIYLNGGFYDGQSLQSEYSDMVCQTYANNTCSQYATLNGMSIFALFNENMCEINLISGNNGTYYYNVKCPTKKVSKAPLTIVVSNNNNLSMQYKVGISYYFGGYTDSNDNSQIVNNTNDINNKLSDSSIDTNNTTSSTTSWGNKNASNGTVTNLLTLPISLLQAIVNGIQSSCTSFNLGSLFGTNIVLPCINIGSLIGSGLWSTIDILFSGFMILAIAKKLIKIFNDFTNLKTNQVDELYGGGK